MLSNTGKARRYRHNLQLAALLSFVAGLVNVGGFLSLNVFTTNITGHFAGVAEQLALSNVHKSFIFLLYILSFLAGSFASGVFMDVFGQKHIRLGNIVPMLIEIVLLIVVSILIYEAAADRHLLGILLLFAMGLQNAMVTKISNAVVRTTHFTGIFTDLGIDLAHLCTSKHIKRLNSVKLNILLRVVIILCFFSACLIGGYMYRYSPAFIFLFAASILLVIITADYYASKHSGEGVK